MDAEPTIEGDSMPAFEDGRPVPFVLPDVYMDPEEIERLKSFVEDECAKARAEAFEEGKHAAYTAGLREGLARCVKAIGDGNRADRILVNKFTVVEYLVLQPDWPRGKLAAKVGMRPDAFNRLVTQISDCLGVTKPQSPDAPDSPIGRDTDVPEQNL